MQVEGARRGTLCRCRCFEKEHHWRDYKPPLGICFLSSSSSHLTSKFSLNVELQSQPNQTHSHFPTQLDAFRCLGFDACFSSHVLEFRISWGASRCPYDCILLEVFWEGSALASTAVGDQIQDSTHYSTPHLPRHTSESSEQQIQILFVSSRICSSSFALRSLKICCSSGIKEATSFQTAWRAAGSEWWISLVRKGGGNFCWGAASKHGINIHMAKTVFQ